MDRSRVQQRVTVAEAADRLGVSKDAVRARIKRGTIDHERDEAGNVFVFVPWGAAQDANQGGDQGGDANADQPTDHANQGGQGEEQGRVEAELRDRLRYVERQLEQEQRAHAELRRLLAGALERLPAQIEAPGASSEPRDEPETGAEGPGRGRVPAEGETPSERRSWWRRFFGIE